MAGTPHDSVILRDLMSDRDMGKLFTDTAELRALLLVWGALAQAQAAEGLIPETAAAAIQRAAMEVQIDPAALAGGAAQNAVMIPALVEAFRAEIGAPEHAQWVHFGATSQDILDTGLILRLRQVLALIEARLGALLGALADLAEAEADTPCPALTYGQDAVPTSFGAIVAGWGQPLLALLGGLPQIRAGLLQVSLSGAAGTLAAMGTQGPAIRARLAEGLGLGDPGASWHSSRHGLTAFAAWLTRLSVSLGRLGEDLIWLAQSPVAAIALPEMGGSSTMPQKQNPVAPSVLVALARQAVHLNGALQEAGLHRHQRDATAWMLEWLNLPQLCLGAGRGLLNAQSLATGIAPDRTALAARLGDGQILAEALSFALAQHMPRPEAQAAIKRLAPRARAENRPLPALVQEAFADIDLSAVSSPETCCGTAPTEARDFAILARQAARTKK